MMIAFARPAALLLGIAALATMATAASAQSDTASKTPAFRLVTLGTAAGPIPRKDRAQSSNLLTVNGTNYLIDAGDGVSRRLVQADIPYTSIGTIFITHHHDDHDAGLALQLDLEWQFNRKEPINVYGPPGTVATVNGALQFLAANDEIRATEKKLDPPAKMIFGHDVAASGLVYQDANVKVFSVENTHFHFPEGSPAYGKYKSYSYRFETPQHVIVFTGDTGPSDAVAQLAKGADILVSEVLDPEEALQDVVKAQARPMTPAQLDARRRHMEEEHLSPEAVGRLAAAAGVKSVILTHLPMRFDEKTYLAGIRKHFSGKVAFANDLMVF